MPFQKTTKETPAKKAEVVVPATQAGKLTALAELSKVLDKEFNTTNTLQRIGKQVGKLVPSIYTGIPSLDYHVFGCGGLPRGSIIEIYGPESSGKSTMALQFVAAEQEAGGLAAYIDMEHTLDPTYATCLGVNVNDMMVSQPDDGNQALNTVKKLIESQLVSIIVVDSIAALVPKAELEGDIGNAVVGLQARMMSQALRQITPMASKNKVTIIFINQLREKIGVMFGNPETTTGGKALKFYATIRLDVRKREAITLEKNGPPVGHTLHLKAQKNKASPPFRETDLDLYYPGTHLTPGIDKIGDLISFAKDKGVFEMAGTWFKLDLGNTKRVKKDGKEVEVPVGIEQLAQGVPNLKDEMKANPKIEQILRKRLLEIKKAEIDKDVKAAEALL